MSAGTMQTALPAERDRASESPADRLLGTCAFWIHRLFRRRLADATPFASEVARRTAWLAGESLEARVPPLRYRLRASGFTAGLVAECFALFCAALRRADARSVDPRPAVLGAARVMVHGGIVELERIEDRRRALALAAAAFALRGTGVHLLAASATRAGALAQAIRGPFAELGIGVALLEPGLTDAARRQAHSSLVVCGALRDLGLDHLRERVASGGPPRRVLGTLERLAGEASAGAWVLHHAALIDEADEAMLDDARIPLVLSVECAVAAERLLYEQALELARSLREPDDFDVDSGEPRLTPRACERLQRLTQALGGAWMAREPREALIERALEALHLLQRDRDYQVAQGRVEFALPPEDEPEGASQLVLRRLVETKEGCRLSGERIVVARSSVPRVLDRYAHVAGACQRGHRLEREFWRLYRLQTVRAERGAQPFPWTARIVRGVAEQGRAIVESLRASAPRSTVIALRSPAALEALLAVLGNAGVRPPVVRGAGDPAEQAAVAALDGRAGVVLSLHPAERAVRRGTDCAPVRLIVAELHEAERQLEHIRVAYGADSCEIVLSLEDQALEAHLRARDRAAAVRALRGGTELPAPSVRRWIRRAQRNAERAAELARHESFLLDRHLDDLLAFSGARD